MIEDKIKFLLNDKEKGKSKILDKVFNELSKQINDPFFYISYEALWDNVYLSMNWNRYKSLLCDEKHFDLTMYGLVFDRYGFNSSTNEIFLFYKWVD